MLEKFCVHCGKKIMGLGTRYCGGECYREAAKRRYKQLNPDTLKGSSTGTTGAISELRVAVDLLARDYNVFRALSPSCPCDLAILKDGKLLRVEVRTSFVDAAGKVFNHRGKWDDPQSIDVYAWVLPGKIVYEPELQ